MSQSLWICACWELLIYIYIFLTYYIFFIWKFCKKKCLWAILHIGIILPQQELQFTHHHFGKCAAMSDLGTSSWSTPLLAPGFMLQVEHPHRLWVTYNDSETYVAFVVFIFRDWFLSHSPKLTCETRWSWGYPLPAQRSTWRNVAWSPSCGKLLELNSCDTEEETSHISS